jgi:putative colanic acid biosynthesis acetyltransferase WcaF
MKKKYYKGKSTFSFKANFIRLLWSVVYYLLFRFSPLYLVGYRRFILIIFGAKIDMNVNIYPCAKIWLPSNLSMKKSSCLGRNVNIYNQGHISIGKNTIISQNSHLCASSHNYSYKNPKLPLYTHPIIIGDNCWVCADAFIGPGIKISSGSIIGARTVIFKDTVKDGVYLGNPGKLIKLRKYKKN